MKEWIRLDFLIIRAYDDVIKLSPHRCQSFNFMYFNIILPLPHSFSRWFLPWHFPNKSCYVFMSLCMLLCTHLSLRGLTFLTGLLVVKSTNSKASHNEVVSILLLHAVIPQWLIMWRIVMNNCEHWRCRKSGAGFCSWSLNILVYLM
jgi:hypothetical protein